MGRPRLVLPLPQEQFPQKGIQRLLLTSQFLAATTVMLSQGAQEPLEHQKGPLGGVRLLCGRDQDRGMFGPI